MTNYIIRRILIFIPMMLLTSMVSFVIMQLPKGDYLQQKLAYLESIGGDSSSMIQIKQLRAEYGLDKPMYLQYASWIYGIITKGHFGRSFAYEKPVNDVVWSYMGFTVLIAAVSMIFVYIVSVPAGIFAAVKKYKWQDNLICAVSFVGMSLPEFMIALLLLVFGIFVLDYCFIGLFSSQFYFQPWSFAKFVDLLKHLPVPAIIVAVNGTAGLVRIMRSSMLEVLGQQYIQTAYAKGISENAVLYKHALRVAVNPIISILGMSLPVLLSGSTIISIVLNLPTAGFLLFESLKTQDMYLAGTLLMLMSFMLLVGNLIADIALAIVDPRIRYD